MEIVIVGGGITGLSAAWFCQKKYPSAKITLLEKKNRLGGWIQTSVEHGFLFEKGPRTFQLGRSPYLLSLIDDLKLNIISSSKDASRRFLYYRNKLHSIAPLMLRFFPWVLKEPFVKPTESEDESIYDFAARRFSPKIAQMLFDPMTLGIYAGDIKKLSIRTCFPSLYQWEKEKGSVLKGLFSAPKTARGLFTIKEGMQTLVDKLQEVLSMDVIFNCAAEQVGQNEVVSQGKTYSADLVIDARPPPFPKNSIWVVNLGFDRDVLSKKGFGYLVPSFENHSLLGMIFDSAIFPQQNQSGKTRLTAMIRSREKDPLNVALLALQDHLKIDAKPIFTSTFLALDAIAQFEVGCTYPHGISVDACVKRASSLF